MKIIEIDLGTTNSCVSVLKTENIKLFQMQKGIIRHHL